MKHDTALTIVTQSDVINIEINRNEYLKALDELERLNANYESFGTFHPIKPRLSYKAKISNLKKKKK
jgi:hypothetical protein